MIDLMDVKKQSFRMRNYQMFN